MLLGWFKLSSILKVVKELCSLCDLVYTVSPIPSSKTTVCYTMYI